MEFGTQDRGGRRIFSAPKKTFFSLAILCGWVFCGSAPAQAPFPFSDGFETGTFSAYWTTNTTSTNGRIRVAANGFPFEGTYHATLDRAASGEFSLNELVLTADLSGQTNVYFDCWTKCYGDENHAMPVQFAGATNADGIALSVDGTNWHRLAGLRNPGAGVFSNVSVDVVAFAAARGLSLESPVRIKFQQYDDFPMESDGWAFDGVQLYDRSQVADLALTLVDSPDPVATGSNLTYALVLSNSAPAMAENVFLTNRWPAGATLVSTAASRGAWTTNGNEWVGDLGSFAGGDAATMTVVVRLASAGVVTNTAEVSSTTADLQAANNRRVETTTVDLHGGDLFFYYETATLAEDGGGVWLYVVRTNGLEGAVSFDFETVDGTATAESDYAATNGTLAMTNGQYYVAWFVSVLNDELVENAESFTVRLSNPTGGARLVAPSNATIQIRDDDAVAAMPFAEGFESGALSNYWTTYTTGVLGPQITVSNAPHAGSRHVNMNGDYLSYSLNELILKADLSGKEGVHLRFWHKRLRSETDNAMSDSFANHANADGVAISVDGTNWFKVHGLALADTGTNEYRQFDIALDPILAARGLAFTDRVRLKFQMYGYYYPPNYGRFFDDISLYTSAGDLRFAAPDWTASEGGGAATVAVERVNGDSGEVRVDYATVSGTATEGGDYAATSGTLVFTNGVRSQTLVVPVLQDLADEPAETFGVQIFNALGGAALLSPTQAVVAIEDDDGPGELSFAAAQYAEQENNGAASIAVRRRFGDDGEVSVRYRTQAGTATPGADYEDVAGTLVFSDGSLEESFEVPLLDDATIEGAETLQVFLEEPEGAELAAPTNAWLTLQDDEAPRAAFPFYEGFESGVWSNYWTTNATGAGRIRLLNPTNGFEGNRSLAMDSASGAALNEATLTVDLAGQTNVIFRCWTRDYADAAHPMPATFVGSTNADGIAVSADGLTWHRLVDLTTPGARTAYTNFTADLAAFAAERGLPLTATFRIRFQQYDTAAYPARGRSFDHVSLAPSPAATSAVICAQGFEGEPGDTWNCRLAPATGQIAVRSERRAGGSRSLRLTGSNSLNADPAIEFDNVSILGRNHVRLAVAFSASGPDNDDDLWLDLSYDNGATWTGAGYVKLMDGYSNAEIPFGGTSVTNPTTVTNNPWVVAIQAGRAQVKARLRFDERSGYNNGNDQYFVDDVVLYYLPTNQPPTLNPIGDRTALVSNRLAFAVVASDIDSNTVTLVASNLPAGAVFAPVSGREPVTNLFEFTPEAAQADAAYPIVFHAWDADGYQAQTVTVRVLDKVVTFSTNRLFADEEAGGVAVGVALSRPADATVPLALGGTAVLDADYVLSSTALVFAVDGPGEQWVTIAPLDDEEREGPETIRLEVAGNPETTAGDGGCEVFIRDDDSVTVVSANLTSGGTAIYQGAGARILQALTPDVVAIQEFNPTNAAGHRDFVDLNFGTNFFYCVEPADALPNGVISRWPILEWGEWDDPLLIDRDFVWATVDLPGGRPLHVVSVHLKAGSTADEKAKRIEQAQMLTNYIAQAGYHPADHVVVCGDLNIQSRTEMTLQILAAALSDAHKPTDQFGDTDTNQGRDKPYDVVLPNAYLDARHLPVRCGGRTFPEGLVFDTRLWSESSIPYPAQVSDSAALSMQHMGVEKLFGLDRFVSILTQADAAGSVSPANPEVGVGSNQTFVATAAPYFHVSGLASNGAAWTPPGQPAEVVWTWTNAQENAWLDVSFAENLTSGHGIPEWWLAAHGITNGFDEAEAEDLDEDGVPTWHEFTMDTDPDDPDSVLRMDTMEFVFGPPCWDEVWTNTEPPYEVGTATVCTVLGYVMGWPASTGRVYDLEYRADLLGDVWLPMPGMTNLTSQDGHLSVTNLFHAGPARMIRIQVREP